MVNFYKLIFFTFFCISFCQELSVKKNQEKVTCYYGEYFKESFKEYEVFESTSRKNGQILFSKEILPSFLEKKVTTELSIVGTNEFPNDCYGIDVEGDVAFCSDQHGLISLNISDPTNPVVLKHFKAGGWSDKVIVSKEDNIAFVSSESSGLYLFNITDPANFTVLSITDTDDARESAFFGQFVFVAEDESGLAVIDFSDPHNSTLVATLDLPETRASSIAISKCGNYAYIGDHRNPYHHKIIDISMPSNPLIIGELQNCSNSIYGFDVVEDLLYVGDYDNGITIYNISDPSNPIYLGGETYTGNSKSVMGINIKGKYAYYADEDQHLWIVDVSDPKNIISIGDIQLYECPSGVKVFENHAYVADYDFGLSVVHIDQETRINGTCSELGNYEIEMIGCEYVDNEETICGKFSFEIEVICKNLTCKNGEPNSDCTKCECSIGATGPNCDDSIYPSDYSILFWIAGIAGGSLLLILFLIIIVVIVIVVIIISVYYIGRINLEKDEVVEDEEYTKELKDANL